MKTIKLPSGPPLSQERAPRAASVLVLLMSVLVLLFAAAGCGSTGGAFDDASNDFKGASGAYETPPAPPGEAVYTVFLVGDAGEARAEPLEPALRLLNDQLRRAGASAAVLFLGDNLYPAGLPPAGDPARPQAEERLDAQLRAVDGFSGRVFFLPGNHDWADDRAGGWDAVRRQEAYVEARLGARGAFLPDGGCPGPVTVELREDLRLLVLDTEWWIYPHEKPTLQNSDCPFAEKDRFLAAVDSVVQASSGRRLLVAAHHPMYSNGEHGGYFPRGTSRSEDGEVDYLHLPLRFVGPLLPWVGLRQSLAGYGELREHLTATFEQHDGLVYASGHSHNLQYHPVEGQHYLISGAGTKLNFAAGGGTAAFAYNRKGFLTLTYYANGAVRLAAWTPEAEGQRGREVYANVLQPPPDSASPARAAEAPKR